jgi:opacity protein-like surface antigen
VALGLDYASRKYVAERGGLMGAVLDAPDVAYSAVSPGAWLRVPVTSSVAVFGGADGLLIFEAGGIQKTASYGPATVYGLEASAGVDIALAKQIALRVGLEYSQIMFKFTPKGASLANNRDNDPATQDVMGATDRSIGGAVTLGFVY